MVVDATPCMLHAGLSLQIFEKWCSDEKNMIIMPGYCVAGTVGHKILNGAKRIEIKKGIVHEVKMSVQYMSFSAHADAKGIMQLITWCEPKSVMLVHGEAEKMRFLKAKIKEEHGLECYMPANGETAVIPSKPAIPAKVSVSLLKHEAELYSKLPPDNRLTRLLHGVLMMKPDGSFTIVDPEVVCKEYDLGIHTVRFTSTVSVQSELPVAGIVDRLLEEVKPVLENTDYTVQRTGGNEITIQSVMLQVDESEESVKDIRVSWAYSQDSLGSNIFKVVQNL